MAGEPWLHLTERHANGSNYQAVTRRDPRVTAVQKYERAQAQLERHETDLRSLLAGVRILHGPSTSAPLVHAAENLAESTEETIQTILRLAALADDAHAEHAKELRADYLQAEKATRRVEEQLDEARDLLRVVVEVATALCEVIEEGPMGGKGRSTPASRAARKALIDPRLRQELNAPRTGEAPF